MVKISSIKRHWWRDPAAQWSTCPIVAVCCSTGQEVFTWFGQGSCIGLRFPTVLSYLVYSVPKFQSNCCAQKIKTTKNKTKRKKYDINMGHDSFKNTKMSLEHEGNTN